MTAAGFAQKIILPFHLSYLLIFFKSVSDISFLGCPYKKESVVEISSEEIISFPGFFFFLSIQGISARN